MQTFLNLNFCNQMLNCIVFERVLLSNDWIQIKFGIPNIYFRDLGCVNRFVIYILAVHAQ